MGSSLLTAGPATDPETETGTSWGPSFQSSPRLPVCVCPFNSHLLSPRCVSSRPGYKAHTAETVLLVLNLGEVKSNGMQCV